MLAERRESSLLWSTARVMGDQWHVAFTCYIKSHATCALSGLPRLPLCVPPPTTAPHSHYNTASTTSTARRQRQRQVFAYNEHEQHVVTLVKLLKLVELTGGR